jgi:hypothetical protein
MTITANPPGVDIATVGPRAEWLRDVRWLLGIAEAYPRLPLPHAGPAAVIFYLDTFRKTEGPRVLADAEKILADELGVTFRPAKMRPESASWFILAAKLESGLRIEIRALATSVATRHPLAAGDIEWWVRIPVETEGEAA